MAYRHPVSPELNPQKVSIGASSAQSAATASTSKVVRVCSDTDCWIATGVNPTAALTSFYLPAKFPQVLGIEPGDKVAVIGTSGNLYITEGFAAI